MSTNLGQAPTSAEPAPAKAQEHHWVWVLCLLGLDYFSTLAYQPSITYSVAGRLGPIATAIVVFITLFAALPVYWRLAARSSSGLGGIGLMERLVHGWRGKTLVLILLGFAAADFTMLKSISMADASVHLLNNHDLYRKTAFERVVEVLQSQADAWLGADHGMHIDPQLLVTLAISGVGFFFWFMLRKGFNQKVLVVSVPVVFAYLAMSGVILAAHLAELVRHPELIENWVARVQAGDWGSSRWAGHSATWPMVWLVAFLFLPNLALGLSGFELSMILMPQVRGDSHDPARNPVTRVRNTRKVLVSAAVIMSVYLLSAVTVTTLFVPPAEFDPDGRAVHRSLAYLAHGGDTALGDQPVLPIFGPVFGAAYDIVTILILAFAGTSVVTALGVLLPQFLLRFGMEFRWTQRWGVMLGIFAVINLAVTVWFHAHVDEQRTAYATGVLVMLSTAAAACFLEMRGRALSPGATFLTNVARVFFGLVALLFLSILLGVTVRSISGIAIASVFIGAILAMSVFSRAMRADELRTSGFEFVDDVSRVLWDTLRTADFPVLVPHRPGQIDRADREKSIRENHQLADNVDIVFVEVELADASDFFQRLMIEVKQEKNRFTIHVRRSVSVAHAIAAVALEMSRHSKPPGVHFGWTDMNILAASWSYFAFGEGNVPFKVRELIHLNEADAEKRPRVIVG